MSLLTWERYSSLHNIVSKDDFDKAEKQAESEIRNVMGVIHFSNWITGNSNLTHEIYYEQLLDCICNVINYNVTVGSKAGQGVASVSNDGYSESYVLQTQSQATEELHKNIRKWLSGTGLVRAY